LYRFFLVVLGVETIEGMHGHKRRAEQSQFVFWQTESRHCSLQSFYNRGSVFVIESVLPEQLIEHPAPRRASIPAREVGKTCRLLLESVQVENVGKLDVLPRYSLAIHAEDLGAPEEGNGRSARLGPM